MSVCGRPVERVRPFLQPRARLLVLSADATSPRLLAEWLVDLGLGAVRCHVLEALGGANERCRSFVVEDGPPPDMGALNLLALEVPANVSALCLPRCAGLPDSCFEHDGQLTRQDIRALTLSALAPRQGNCCGTLAVGRGLFPLSGCLLHLSVGR